MFYAASALLGQRGLSFLKHSAVVAALGRESVKTGLVAPAYHYYLHAAQERRLRGGYGSFPVRREESAEQIAWAGAVFGYGTGLLP